MDMAHTSKRKKLSISDESSAISFTEIKKVGAVTGCLKFFVEKAEKIISKNGKTFAKFTLSNGKRGKIEAMSSEKCTEENIHKLKEGFDYIVKGLIQAQTRKRKFGSVSTSKFELWFNQVIVLSENSSINRSSSHIQLSDGTKKIQSETSFEETFENVEITGGILYRYMGCEVCTKSLRLPDKDGHFYCKSKTCLKKSGKKFRKMCMMIKGLKIKDESGIEMKGICTFNDDCKDLFGKDASDFIFDEDARETFEKLIGSKITLQVSGYKNLKNGLSSYDLTAKKIVIVHQIESPETFNDEFVCDGPNPDLTDEIAQMSLENLHDDNDIVQVIRRRQYITDEIENYEVQSKPPGCVLIINNYNLLFRAKREERQRTGSKKDVKNLQMLFRNYGYEIFTHIDVESTAIDGIITDFKAMLKEKACDSSIVILMSHGNSHEIEMVDGYSINIWRDVIYKFSEDLFPEFIGKPKMFFFEACQNFELSNDSKRFDTTPKGYSDILVAISSLHGYESHRSKTTGSLFITKLVNVLKKYAHEKHIYEMLKVVQKWMQQFKHKDKKQVCLAMEILFDHFYFPVSRS